MKKLLVIILLISSCNTAFTQQDQPNENKFLLEEVKKQVIQIDSLKRLNASLEKSVVQHQSIIKKSQDSIKGLKTNLSALESFRANKSNMELQLNEQKDYIAQLTLALSEKEKKTISEAQKNTQLLKEAKEQGKNDVLSKIVEKYKNKSFDELIVASKKESVQFDKLHIGKNKEIETILNDLESFFNAKGTLEKKYLSTSIKEALNQLNFIKKESERVKTLKRALQLYETFNKGLKETIQNIMVVDKEKSVAGMPDHIQKMKLYDINVYIFNYDFNFSEYPYLTEIMLELIKRKQLNPDADIADLLDKL